MPLSVFLYRDYGLREDTSTADFQAFVSEFRSEFGFAALGGTAVFGELFETDSSYLQDVEVTQRISAGMARTPKPIRRLTAAELGIETAETDSAGDEREIASPEARTARRIPEQADAPIITGITDHRLIKISGRPIRQTASGAEVSKYLESRFKRVISDIEGQATKIVVDDFRQGEELLHDWSISKLLAFGTHLYLLGGHVNDLKQEFLEDKARRLDALMHSAREFMNSFKEWHEYVEQSTLLDVEVGEGAKEIISAAKDAAKGLAREKESVDPEISSALTECANTANRKGSKQGVVVNVMSALRSITNISISFIEYVTKVAKDSYVAMTENDRVRKLLGFIRDFFPTTLRLATIYTSHSWMLAFSDLIRAACERRRKSVQAM